MGESWRKGTICVQGGYTQKNGEPRVLPLYQSTTHKYDTSDDLAALFDLQAEGYIYKRIGNPTLAAFEQKLADLEGGVGAVATASGQGAKEFISNVKLATLVTQVADARTCVIHPASTTHRQLIEEQQHLAGVTSDLIRVSVGIEDVKDIITDLTEALAGGRKHANYN